MFFYMSVFMPVLLPTLVIKASCDNHDNPDVFVRYSGHAEANDIPDHRLTTEITSTKVTVTKATSPEIQTSEATTNDVVFHITTTPKFITKRTTPIDLEDETESVVFVPNEAPVVRLEDNYGKGAVRLQDLMLKQSASDMFNGHVRLETEAPADEIFFVPGVNKDLGDKKEKDEERNGRRNMDEKTERRVIYNTHKLDCTHLDCNNSMKSICGGRIINNKMHYRLFLNDCYFRKVNCNFKYEVNRYTIVPSDKCAKFGANGEKPFVFTRKSLETPKPIVESLPRRSFSSRRSMSMNIHGKFCSHPCPISCPEDYEPECAISATGKRRVFMNHCKLDDNSCTFAIVWHLRPLSECVGGKKADMRQNRFFIGWMQQVGILDNKGRLVLE